MANNAQQYQQQQQQQQVQQQQQQGTNSANPHHCKECGLYLNSAESLEVHLQYHKENLMNKWASPDEANNNTSSKGGATPSPSGSGGHQTSGNSNSSGGSTGGGSGGVVGLGGGQVFVANVGDSTEAMMKKSPEYSRASPENNFGHPPTPQSYHSASSPYQTPENSAFSPGFQGYQQQPIKIERSSPTFQYPFQDGQFFNLDQPPPPQQQQYGQEYPMHKMPTQNSFRYHPYQQSGPYERPVTQVPSSSPAYPPQPTPSPSPKQCDKCGYVCETASLLIEHINVAHPPTPPSMLGNYQFNFPIQPNDIKTEDDAQSEILDLDSHKVVHQVYQEDEKSNSHSVNTMLTSWPQHLQQQQQKMYMPQQQQQQDQRMMMFQQSDYLTAPAAPPQEAYRPFDHLQAPLPQSVPAITSTQVVNQPVVAAPVVNAKSTNWKSNEARRPKTYNCTACNKWFTSSGHLKRHYNTTLHKNAVKSSGQPDPATLPISAHHHPARESTSSRESEINNSNSPTDESRSQDGYGRTAMPQGLLQQPPNGPYDRHHHPMGLGPSPLQTSPPPQQNSMGTSPPNGEAGPSATTNNLDSRGLLSITSTNSINNSLDTNKSTTNILHQQHLTTNTGHPHQQQQYTLMSQQPQALMDNSQFQMYPNECAPHVTQVTATNSLSTTGEANQFTQEYSTTTTTASDSQPLPSFSQFNRYGILLGYNSVANVGGPGPATAPFTSYYSTTTPSIAAAPGSFETFRGTDDGDYKLTVLTAAESDPLAVANNQQHVMLPPLQQQLQQQHLHYITENNNIALGNTYTDIEPKLQTSDGVNIKFEARPRSPEKAHTKRDFEDTTSSTHITSTTAVQVSKNGVHKCYDCDKSFNKSCYLTQHNKTFHNGEKPFKCTRCGKRFSFDEQFQKHSSKHAGEKPHKCELCPKQFNHKTDLRRHMCLHTGQKPYACEICGKGFIRKDHMLKHSEIHNKKPHSKMSVSAR